MNWAYAGGCRRVGPPRVPAGPLTSPERAGAMSRAAVSVLGPRRRQGGRQNGRDFLDLGRYVESDALIRELRPRSP